MLTIRRSAGLIALLLVFGASGTAPMLAQAKTTQRYTATVQSAPLTTENGYPAPGGSALLAGALDSEPLGAGAVIDRVTVTGQPEPNVFSFKGKETDFFAAGTMRNSLTGTATVQADGSQVIAIKGRYTGGSGRYRGVSGQYTFSGTVASGSTVFTGHSRGKVSY